MLQETASEIVIYYLVGTLFVLVLVIMIIFYVVFHQKKMLQLHVKMKEETLKKQQAVFDALHEGQEKERNRLAEELHDGIGAKLSGIKMNLEYLCLKMTDEECKELSYKTYIGLQETLFELREITHNLQSSYLIDKDLRMALLDFIEQLNSRSGVQFKLDFEIGKAVLNTNLKHHCFRIVTELLINIQKHAFAKNAWVQICAEEEKLTITVEDNGKGFDINYIQQGIGLNNVRNRIRLYNGSINIDSSANGTIIIIELLLLNSYEQ